MPLNENSHIIDSLYNDLLHPSVHILGKSLSAVMEFAMTPFTGLQYINEKVKLNLQSRLQQYADRLKSIPEDKRVEVYPEIGVPILQKLSYTTNDEIAEMFITLLINASNIDTLGCAHPTYVSIIECLSPEEARILLFIQKNYISKNSSFIPYMKFRAKPLRIQKEKTNVKEDCIEENFEDFFTYIELKNWLTIIPSKVTLSMPEMINLYLANLIRCGILIDAGDSKVENDEEEYRAIEEYHCLAQYRKDCVPDQYAKIYSLYSHFKVTELGLHFIKMCVSNIL